MDKLTQDDATSHDIVADNIDKLKAIFPEAFTEGKVDFDVLKETLGEYRETREERYNFSWAGKSKARRLAQTPTTGTLRPCPEESVDWDKTENLFIEGDNLEVLKLLQKSYQGQVKMIYIDPPYNTGGDFVYPDKYADNLKGYLEYTNQVDSEGNKQSSNTEASGRFHSNWLNMMLPRIKAAHNLLKKDGAIFVSIDEAEHVRLRAVMDELFGQENFIADIVWAAGRKNDSRLISISHEYIVCYARNLAYLKEKKIEWKQRKKGLEAIYAKHKLLLSEYDDDYKIMTKELKLWYKSLPDGHPSKAHKHYSNIDARGVYFAADISWPGGGGPQYEVLHPDTKKPVKNPARGWMTADQEKMADWIEDKRVHFGEDETSVPCIKAYLKDKEHQAPYSVFYQDGRAASKRLRTLMEEACFDFPKDEEVLQEILGMMTGESDICMDFFAGSGTFGHSVMAQNALDAQDRRYILVQLPEPLDSSKKEQKTAAEYCDQIDKKRNIAELSKERIRRSAAKIKEEKPGYSGDLGFKVFKLDSSNIEAWDSNIENLEDNVLKAANVLKDDRSELDIVYELFLKYGLDLSYPVNTHEVAGKQVYEIGAGSLFICLEDGISTDFVQALIKLYESFDDEAAPRVVFKDSGFKTDAAKKDTESTLKDAGILDVKCL